MIELGAGIGCWVVRAAYAVQQYNPSLPYRLIAVEAEPTHFEWMRDHFLDNGINPDQHLLIHAAVSDKPGQASFYVENPGSSADPSAWYGQALTKDYEVDLAASDATYGDFRVRRHQSGAKSIIVPAITLASILDGLQQVDLIHIDIQGAELGVVGSAIQELGRKVKRLHIGTHGHDIEAGLRELLKSHQWRCLADYPSFSREPTPWGPIDFQDGVQSWINPRFLGPWGRLSAWARKK
jgi:FkbM family methyltransferase